MKPKLKRKPRSKSRAVETGVRAKVVHLFGREYLFYRDGLWTLDPGTVFVDLGNQPAVRPGLRLHRTKRSTRRTP